MITRHRIRRRGFTAVAVCLAVAASFAAPLRVVEAQDRSGDLTKLTLQDLMGLDVVSVNVLGAHTHLSGQWMIGYRMMFENMDGERNGTHRVSHGKVLEQFMTVPTDMTMQMHMAMLMYAPTDDLSLMAMLPYVRKSMNHVTATGARFRELSEGLGDLELRGLYTLYRVRRYEHRLLLNAGFTVPTGSIDAKDFGPDRSFGRDRLEYPMQLGSGTVDLRPGLTYLGQVENWAWGIEFIPTVRLGRNSHNYNLGNRYDADAFGTRKVTDWLGVTARLGWQSRENINGIDKTLNAADEPTKDPKNQGGRRLDVLLGISLYAPQGILKGHRLAIEGGAPVYQSLEGPQLQTDWLFRVGWQWVF
jgi:acetolactate synthase regulatory subunit